jgi:polysaccharide export outer membrane protein
MNRFLIALLAIGSAYTEALLQNDSRSFTPADRANAAPTHETSPNSALPVADFIIGAEDVLFINVWHEPDFTVTATVRSDGKITFPVVGDIQASGLTTTGLQKQITTELEKFVNEPHVTVIVQEINSQMVHVIGSVSKPGMYGVRSPITVIELLARAGGLAEFARPKEIMIIRVDAGKTRRFRFDYDRFISGQNFQQNITLRAGDVVVIP